MNDPDRTGPYEPATVSEVAPAPPQRIGRYRIERLLGEGGFGIVYLAHDEQLQRRVAIKVPHPQLVAQAADAEAYLSEARTVASLDHPNIVPVYDVGGTEHFPCFIVSKFIEGSTLAQRIKQGRPSAAVAAELVATVAETLHYAHRKGLIHRDVKPGNILLDRGGKPFVADFGLALKEENVGHGPRYAGTPSYMSPEQARGEGHRVDGRSDIFSLAVVLYELLAGRPPFRAGSHADLLEQIATCEARPLRQVDESIPKEVERICFKALAKRAAERYMTAQDMAEDLRHFLAEEVGKQPAGPASRGSALSPVRTELRPPPTSMTKNQAASTSARAPPSDGTPFKIVPKGLRSFDEHDADFFLELLPGPCDRSGLPDSIRFWKARIEESDPDRTFSVGLSRGWTCCVLTASRSRLNSRRRSPGRAK
jgi:serine/threonine protein kinase